MRSAIVAALLAAALAGAGLAQDSCRVYVWDNDAGEALQEYPAASMGKNNSSYYAWSDMRRGTPQVMGQIFSSVPGAIGTNFFVSTGSNLHQLFPAISCSSGGNFTVAWQESTMAVGQRWRIMARCFTAAGGVITSAFQVDTGSAIDKKMPKVARHRRSGKFVVVWQQFDAGNNWNIYARLYRGSGVALTSPIKINDDATSQPQIEPAVAFCDSGILFAWADYRNSRYDIYHRFYDTTLASYGASAKLNDDLYVELHRLPTVAASDSGYFVAAWRDSRISSRCDIYAQRFNRNRTLNGANFQINTAAGIYHTWPAVAMDRGRSFLVAWADLPSELRKWEIQARFYDQRGGAGGSIKTLNAVPDSHQIAPAACFYYDRMSAAWTDMHRARGLGDIFGQLGQVVYGATIDTLARTGRNYRVDNLREFGRKVYYKYPKYDNPATTWNENPRPAAAPDSVRVPLDSSYVLPLLARNIHPLAFVRVRDSDTMKYGRDGQKLNGETYDLCVMDLGYATADLSAGAVSKDEQDSLLKFSSEGGALLCSGNDFGEYHNGTALFDLFGAIYDGPGNPQTTGNIDSLVGMSDAFSKGMVFDYPYQREQDHSVDIIHAFGDGDTIFMSGGPAKWAYCRGISYAAYWKGPEAVNRRNVYLPFAMGALSSDGKHPNTTTELTRRILGFQGFNVEPEPIADLKADTTTATIEGTVTLRWTAVSDDILTERPTSYRLKIREYNAALPDYGKFTSEEDFYDSGQTYYQAWSPAAVGASETQTLYLAPGKSYIYALKAGDESTPTRWSALGAEPMSQTRGDTLTPHFLYLGSGYGLCNQFAASERLDIDNGDTLYFTWSAGDLFFGFSRRDFRTQGDLFIYLDTKTGGADSTIGWWNGEAADTAALFDEGRNFRPDFCFVLDSLGSKCKLMHWTGTAWAESIAAYSSTYYTMDLQNNTLLTTVRVMRNKVGSPSSLKFMAHRLYETSERCYSSFPPDNPTGAKDAKAISRYPFYYSVASLANGLSPRRAAVPLAVELSQFGASAGGGGISLSWATASETGNYQWLIERSRLPDRDFARIAVLPAHGGPSGRAYSHTDLDVRAGGTYYYLLGDQDQDGAVTWHGPVSATAAGSPVAGLWLGQCDPNPVRCGTTIDYAVPRPGRASLKVYDICGREVRTLADGEHGPGRHRAAWNGDNDQGRALASGIYFCRLSLDGQHATRKLVVAR